MDGWMDGLRRFRRGGGFEVCGGEEEVEIEVEIFGGEEEVEVLD